jgi:Glucose / Sorbosone dehydrogenase
MAAVRLAGPFEQPWSIAFLPDHSILVTEKPGRLQLIRPGADPLPVTGATRNGWQLLSGLTPLPGAGLTGGGQASLAERQQWPTAGARFTAARARGRARPRAWRVVRNQIGNMADILRTPRQSGRA